MTARRRSDKAETRPEAQHQEHWTDRRPSRVGKRAVNFYLEPEIWETLKMEAAKQSFRPIQQIMEELVLKYLVDRGAISKNPLEWPSKLRKQ